MTANECSYVYIEVKANILQQWHAVLNLDTQM